MIVFEHAVSFHEVSFRREECIVPAKTCDTGRLPRQQNVLQQCVAVCAHSWKRSPDHIICMHTCHRVP